MMPDEKIKRLLDVLVNRFWRKWSRQPMQTDREWDLFVADVDALFSGGGDYQLAADLIMAFVGEMERRHKEGGQNEN
jgi:hypothetical protein